jgi:hypothetical protein
MCSPSGSASGPVVQAVTPLGDAIGRRGNPDGIAIPNIRLAE